VDVVHRQGVVVHADAARDPLIMRAISLSITNCAQSKVTPDSIMPAP